MLGPPNGARVGSLDHRYAAVAFATAADDSPCPKACLGRAEEVVPGRPADTIVGRGPSPTGRGGAIFGSASAPRREPVYPPRLPALDSFDVFDAFDALDAVLRTLRVLFTLRAPDADLFGGTPASPARATRAFRAPLSASGEAAPAVFDLRALDVSFGRTSWAHTARGT
eukprot:TRINITY_DN5174_c0_g1_i3.p1 TRINITY_DN5174_c0_g1~~TRINITY_DN5174_c0_g1_i3.p1  ORF type:complete len:169 (-),score=28.13 TRINITY_DN5174_c0_g1_i3:537-1043(-)